MAGTFVPFTNTAIITPLDYVTQIFEIFGIPQNISALAVYNISTIFGSFNQAYDLTTVVSNLNTQLNLVTAQQWTRMKSLLDDWDSKGLSYTPMKVSKTAAGSEGEIIDYDKERAMIRRGLANIIGFECPEGGYSLEQKKVMGGGYGISR